MGDEKEFLTALAVTKHGSISPIPFNVRLQQVDPFFSKSNEVQLDGTLYESVEDLDRKPNSLTHHEFMKWRRAVLFISIISIIIQLIISVVAIVQGLKVDSSGTFGFGVETILDIATRAIVIWRFSGSSGMKFSDQKELKAVILLSILMCLFSVGVIVKVIIALTKESKPFKELKLMIICNVGFASFAILSWCKLVVGQKIQSKAVIMDAISTFCATGMAMALLMSLLVYHFTNLWFLDSIVAIIICLLMFAYAVRTLYKIFKNRKSV